MAPARCAASASSSDRSAGDSDTCAWWKRSTSPISRSCSRIGIDTSVAKPACPQCGSAAGASVGDGNHARASPGRHRAAVAVAGMHALFLVGHRHGQAGRRQQQEALVRLVGPAQRDAVRARDAADPLDESVGQLRQRRGLRDQRRHVVQRLEPLALFLEFRRLRGDFRLEVAVHRLQVLGHPVEALGERAELVAGHAVHARAEVAALQAFGRLLQTADGLEHEQVAHVEQHRRPQHREGHHRRLQQVQQRGPARHVALDAGDQRVDVRGECGGLVAQSRARLHGRRDPVGAEPDPVALHHRKVRAHGVVPRHEQRPLVVAVAQDRQAALELVGQLRERRAFAGADRQRHPVRLHPHAARLVHGRRTAFELP